MARRRPAEHARAVFEHEKEIVSELREVAPKHSPPGIDLKPALEERAHLLEENKIFRAALHEIRRVAHEAGLGEGMLGVYAIADNALEGREP